METSQLVLHAQKGDRHAMDDLVQRYYPRVKAVVNAKLGARLASRISPEDVLQDTFVEAFQRMGRFEMRGPAALMSFLSTIALNRIRRWSAHWSRQRRQLNRESPMIGRGTREQVLEPKDPHTGPITSLLNTERSDALTEALRDLSLTHKTVILLRYYQGRSYEDIAQQLQRPTPEAAQELCRRARAKLALALRRRGLAESRAS